ncbi:MAG TPA: uroporphyrinogen decarboxylase [Firmicutes bacterium]|nr:uroporphyrinogen decarboxylase [Bacillota bacterium]
MTRRERMFTTLSHRQPDMIPWQIGFTIEAHAKMVDYLKDPAFTEKIGNHIASFGADRFEEVGPDLYRDIFGVVWDRSRDKSIGVVKEYQIKDGSLGTYRFPDPKTIPFPLQPGEFAQRAPDCFRSFNIGFSMFERAWTLYGMENLLMDMVLNPSFVHELLDAILEFNLGLIERALEYEIDAIYFGDDWGQQRGLIMGIDYWRKFIKPRMAAMFAKAKGAGKYVIVHSCGDVQELFPELIEIGLDIFNTFQPEIMDVKEMKRLYGQHLTFFGGISTQRALPFLTSKEIKELVAQMIADIGKDGGYIVSPTHGITGDTPEENILALIEAVQNQ